MTKKNYQKNLWIYKKQYKNSAGNKKNLNKTTKKKKL